MNIEIEQSILAADKTLGRLGFKRVFSEDRGMLKSYCWFNEIYYLKLTFDRGDFDCEIEYRSNESKYYNLLELVKLLLKEIDFTDEEINNLNLHIFHNFDDFISLYIVHKSLIDNYIITDNAVL